MHFANTQDFVREARSGGTILNLKNSIFTSSKATKGTGRGDHFKFPKMHFYSNRDSTDMEDGGGGLF